MGAINARPQRAHCQRGDAGLPHLPRDPPVKEGGEEPPQQDLVLHPRTEVAVHQLAACDVDPGACDRRQEHEARPCHPHPRAMTSPGPPGPEQARLGGRRWEAGAAEEGRPDF